MKKFKITWLTVGITQIKVLVTYSCQIRSKKDSYFYVGSPLYKAIEDGTFYIDLGYGRYPFKCEEV